MRVTGIATTLLLAAGISAPAFADDACPPLTILTSVDMTIGNSGRVFVPAQIDGTPQNMLVDTGAFFSLLTENAVDALHLTRHSSKLLLVNVAGKNTRTSVTASFALGNLRADSVDFAVAFDGLNFDRDLAGSGGVLGGNMLTDYDLDFDFANKKLNLISRKHCEGKVVYWPAGTVAVVPIKVTDEFHIQVPVQLDGHDYTALLDTGAAYTILDLHDATRDFSLKPGDADTPAHGHLGPGDENPTYVHRFKSLSLKGMAISNPVVALLPDLMGSKLAHPVDTVANRLRDPGAETAPRDMILGMDILRRLHLYIAYTEKKLYITPAAPPAAPAPAAGR
ncbi:MAG TPA: retropepsin-like aspartic protease [Rhizomicrobium sp.]|jgi:predicted aspartyl protease|nr:retropepsin-like aspartic protease [Rhizomicrobium sp.]